MQERFPAIIAQNQQNQNDNSSDVETLAPCFHDRLFTGRDVRTVLVRRHLLNIVDECSGKLGASLVSESLTGRISISEAEPLINCWATAGRLQRHCCSKSQGLFVLPMLGSRASNHGCEKTAALTWLSPRMWLTVGTNRMAGLPFEFEVRLPARVRSWGKKVGYRKVSSKTWIDRIKQPKSQHMVAKLFRSSGSRRPILLIP